MRKLRAFDFEFDAGTAKPDVLELRPITAHTWLRTRWLRPRVVRWMRRNGDRPAIVVDIRYAFDPKGSITRDPWNEIWVTIDGKGAEHLGGGLSGRRSVRSGEHRVRSEGEIEGRDERVLLRDLRVMVEPGSATYVAVSPPHGWLRRRTTNASWTIATVRPSSLNRLHALVGKRLSNVTIV